MVTRFDDLRKKANFQGLLFMLLVAGLVSEVTPLAAFAQSSRSGVWDARSNASTETRPAGSAASSESSGSRVGSSGRSAYYSPTKGAQAAGNAYPYSPRYPQKQGAGQGVSRNYLQGIPSSRSMPSGQAAQSSGRGSKNFRDAVISNGGQRTFTVHVPSSYDGTRQVPLVLAFHGLGMNGVAMEGLTLMDLTSERNGFIVVYPDGVGNRWNDGSARGSNGMDDVAFVVDLIAYLSQKFKIDPRHIHACGISNGGYFAQRLGCELSDRIASIGVISATATVAVCSNCHPRRSMPVVMYLGTEDPLVPREGESKELGKLGEALGISGIPGAAINSTIAKVGGIYTASETAEFWAKINNCSSHPREERMPDRSARDGCKVTRETYGGGSGGSEVVVYTIEGGGHNWPGGSGALAQDVLGVTTFDISASDVCWQFFQSHPR